MLPRRITLHLVAVPALLAFAARASASTIVVDAAGGGQYTDIPPAIAAANPGDVLLVAPGNYSGFVLDKALVVLGGANTYASGPIEVRNVPAGPRAAVVGVRTDRFVVDGCASAVILQELGEPSTASILASADVRVARTDVKSAAADSLDAIELVGAHLELVDGEVRGHPGTPFGGAFGQGSAGGAAVSSTSSRFLAARVDVQGGRGSMENGQETLPGAGGAALALDAASSVALVGPGSFLRGSFSGTNAFYSGCQYNACGSPAAVGAGAASLLWMSGTEIPPHTCLTGIHCFVTFVPTTSGVTLVTPPSADPSLETIGTPAAGSPIQFVVRGEVGATAVLRIGRGFAVGTSIQGEIEPLIPGGRAFQLGAIPASGAVTFQATFPATLPRGFTLNAQAEVTGSSGLRRSNSAPVILR